ncbi:hypothetical protein ACN6KF_003003 [Labrys sp. La1]|uniref:hypothetical protein n=1 Tax=Labrys sp. La1 TaxID=3404917 RepID=UPI003EB97612
MTRTDLLDLAERVEAGSGADDNLDRDVALATGLVEVPHPFPDPDRIYSEYRRRNPDGSHSTGSFYVMINRVSSSLDAVEALRERLLPGSVITVKAVTDYVTCSVSYAGRWSSIPARRAEGAAPTEPRARLAALLRAYAETVGG